MGIAICSRLPDNLPTATIESEINHLKAVTEAQLIRESRVIHPGSRVVAPEAGVVPARRSTCGQDAGCICTESSQ